MFFVKWCGSYVHAKGLRCRTPYTTDQGQAKVWKTRKGAERYLSLKDPGWASNCEIEENSNGS